LVVSSLTSCSAAMTQNLTRSDISYDSKNYLSKAGFFSDCCGIHPNLHFSLHDALPIWPRRRSHRPRPEIARCSAPLLRRHRQARSEEHTSELQSLAYLVCRLLLEKKKTTLLKLVFSSINMIGVCNMLSFISSLSSNLPL